MLESNLPCHWSDGISHLDLSLSKLIFRCFLRRSVLTTYFQFNFGLLRYVGRSTLKLMIFFVRDVSFCHYKSPDSLSLFRLKTSSKWWTWILLLRSSVECSCSILLLLNQRIIAWSHLLICNKSSVDRGQVSLPYRTALLAQVLNTFSRLTIDISLFLSIGRSACIPSWSSTSSHSVRETTCLSYDITKITEITSNFKFISVDCCKLKKDRQLLW